MSRTRPKGAQANAPAKIMNKERWATVVEEPLSWLLRRLGIGENDWDWLLVGDGSGSEGDRVAGWACVAIDRLAAPDQARAVWSGCATRGSPVFAEANAFIGPLEWVAATERARQELRLERHGTSKTARVHLVTDSEECFRYATGPPQRREGFWRVFDCFDPTLLSLRWHCVLRETVGLHVYVDRVSRAARQLYEWSAPGGPVLRNKSGEVLGSVYDFNPPR